MNVVSGAMAMNVVPGEECHVLSLPQVVPTGLSMTVLASHTYDFDYDNGIPKNLGKLAKPLHSLGTGLLAGITLQSSPTYICQAMYLYISGNHRMSLPSTYVNLHTFDNDVGEGTED